MKKRYYIFLLFFIILIIGSLISLLLWNNDNKKVKDIVKEEEKHLVKEEEIYKLDRNIKNDNPDTIGWIIVKGTNINYPVLQTTDNEYYLNHDFSNNYNNAGWIFMDYKNKLDDQNLVIYGHHRRDGSMFGDIDKLLEEDYYKNNNEIIFVTPEEATTYQIFSVYSTSPDDIYISNNFDNFDYYLNIFKNRSNIEFNDSLEKTTQIITLSTCSNNNIDRIVVHAYKNN